MTKIGHAKIFAASVENGLRELKSENQDRPRYFPVRVSMERTSPVLMKSGT